MDSTVIADRRNTNTIQNDPSHPGIDLEAADGLDDLIAGNNRGDAGDPFPGSTGNTEFNDVSNPNALSYAGLLSGFGLANITESGEVITLDILFGPPWGDVTEDGVVTVADAEAILLERVGGASGANMAFADVDGDGDADARDGLIVHSFILGVDLSSCAECRAGEPAATGAPAQVVHLRGTHADAAAVRRIERVINTRTRH